MQTCVYADPTPYTESYPQVGRYLQRQTPAHELKLNLIQTMRPETAVTPRAEKTKQPFLVDTAHGDYILLGTNPEQGSKYNFSGAINLGAIISSYVFWLVAIFSYSTDASPNAYFARLVRGFKKFHW